MRRTRSSLFNVPALAALAMAAVAGAAAEPPSDEVIDAKIQAMQDWWQDHSGESVTREMLDAFVNELLADLTYDEMSGAQIGKLSQLLMYSSEHQDRAAERLVTLAKAPGLDGAEAAIALFRFRMGAADESVTRDALETALSHPSLAEALQTDTGGELLGSLPYAGDEVLQSLAPQVLALEKLLSDSMPPRVVAGALSYLTAVDRLGDAADPKTRERIRLRLVKLFQTAVANERAKEDGGMADRLEKGARFLDGAYARGELIDHRVPEITLSWSKGPHALASLDELKGKVVVLDFWATWCGPCVASFPNLRELQERYEGYDVAIVGVTSLQGKHYPGDGAEPIDTEDDPDKEYELMAGYMGQKNITWTIAFSEEDVFNPDFGVRGIPHVAIIDTKGLVRSNGLHPMDPLPEKSAKIDKLLKDAGLPAPVPVVEDDAAKPKAGADDDDDEDEDDDADDDADDSVPMTPIRP